MSGTAKAFDKRTSAELQEKFRRQGLTHGLEAGHRHHDEENPGEFDEGDELISENEENLRPKKRNIVARDQEPSRSLANSLNMKPGRKTKALEETAAYNRRAEERHIRSLEVATATLNVTQKLVENSGI